MELCLNPGPELFDEIQYHSVDTNRLFIMTPYPENEVKFSETYKTQTDHKFKNHKISIMMPN